ncbi:hypothetical protein ACVBEH_09290 [Roseateles sp. GG27B]
MRTQGTASNAFCPANRLMLKNVPDKLGKALARRDAALLRVTSPSICIDRKANKGKRATQLNNTAKASKSKALTNTADSAFIRRMSGGSGWARRAVRIFQLKAGEVMR